MPEDPKNKLTNWLTDGDKGDNTERTRVMTKEQMDLYLAYDMLENLFGLTYLKDIIKDDKKNMMAYQGKRSEEITDCLSHQDFYDNVIRPTGHDQMFRKPKQQEHGD